MLKYQRVSNVDEEDLLGPFREILLRRCGLSFPGDRKKTLLDGISQRISVRGVASATDYHRLLTEDRGEFQLLVERLTVNETYFFREPGHLRVMVEKIAPELLLKREDAPVRIVCMGCSTGEEPYSIAMMLNERYGPLSESRFTIAGADIDASAIAAARQGVYGSGSFRGMDEAIRRRYFSALPEGKFQLGEIRHRVRFEVANLLENPYPPALQQPDIIFYRNVSIYFPREVQREIFSHLAALLQPGGYLFVGASETMHHDLAILPLTERDGLFFFHNGAAARPAPKRSAPEPRPAGSGTPRRSASSVPGSHPPAKSRPAGPAVSPPHLPADDREVRRLFDEALDNARKGDREEALALLERLIARDGTFVKAYALKGSILMSTSHYQEAAAACQAALRLDPLCLEACLMLGITARHQGDDAEAHRRFREAVYLDPSCWLAHYYLAGIALGQGDKKRARSGYETALRILEEGPPRGSDAELFPLSINAGEFMTILRHKILHLKENR